ncbi:hypothetical protein FOZ61_001348, partial [Perkinsus olseni]
MSHAALSLLFAQVKADDFVRALSEKGKRRSRTRSRANERRKKEETKEEESSTGTDTTGATSSDEGSDPSPAKKERDQSGVKLKAELEETSEALPTNGAPLLGWLVLSMSRALPKGFIESRERSNPRSSSIADEPNTDRLGKRDAQAV